jgi:hypothetical protein
MTSSHNGSTQDQKLENEATNAGCLVFPDLTGIAADMLQILTQRSKEAADQERDQILSWAKKHPNMPLSLAARFIELGEHNK